MAGWHHVLNGRESEWTPGDGDGQGGLACCDSWGRKESDKTERLNWTELPVLLRAASQSAVPSLNPTAPELTYMIHSLSLVCFILLNITFIWIFNGHNLQFNPQRIHELKSEGEWGFSECFPFLLTEYQTMIIMLRTHLWKETHTYWSEAFKIMWFDWIATRSHICGLVLALSQTCCKT